VEPFYLIQFSSEIFNAGFNVVHVFAESIVLSFLCIRDFGLFPYIRQRERGCRPISGFAL
jgi:hypothetical protein